MPPQRDTQTTSKAESPFWDRPDRRKHQVPFDGPDRRAPAAAKAGWRIPIFVRLTALSLLQILVIISIISLTMLTKQKQQFIDQLISFGTGLVKITAQNSPDKILSEEDVALLQLINDIADNDQVAYVLVVDNGNKIRAHSSMELIGTPFLPPQGTEPLTQVDEVIVETLIEAGSPLILFHHPITYQGIRVGDVYLALSQEKINRSIRSSSYFIGLFTAVMLLIGLITSIGVSLYLSRPIQALKTSAEIIGDGDFSHQVDISRNDELGDLGLAFNKMAMGLGERELIRETFGKYVTPEIRDQILSGRVPLDGERREATLLFSDLRGFTAYVERNEPEAAIRGMRSYFTAMQAAISRHGGLVLQYIGDEIEAVFGVPIGVEDHAERAVRAALDMRRALETLNRTREKEGMEPFRHGIGIHTGNVLAGNTGSDDRLSYTLIGDTVNLASRIQAMTKDLGWDILVYEGTMARIRTPYRTVREEPRKVKGYSKPIVVYRILGEPEADSGQPLDIKNLEQDLDTA